jgi:hypothetical protein
MSDKRKTFRTVEGFKWWACDHGMQMAHEAEDRWGVRKFVENACGEILVVQFDRIDGRITDAHLHREHVTHSLGSNTLATLLRLTIRGNRRAAEISHINQETTTT